MCLKIQVQVNDNIIVVALEMRTLRRCYTTSKRINTMVREKLKVANTVAFRQGQRHQGQFGMQKS